MVKKILGSINIKITEEAQSIHSIGVYAYATLRKRFIFLTTVRNTLLRNYIFSSHGH